MNKTQKIIVVFFIITMVIIVSLIAVYFYKQKNANNDANLPTKTSLYYREDCAHCKNVEAFIEQNNISSKISILHKEVKINQTNAKELIDVEEYCKIDKSYIGAVPLLYSNKICYLGDVDIINFLNQTITGEK